MVEADSPKREVDEGWPIFDLWKEYESIATHFNDILLKLRVQALAVVVAISSFIGVSGKISSDSEASWQIATAIFCGLFLFWISIWVLDLLYYNRLLRGATSAIFDLEVLSQTHRTISKIELSSKIRKATEAGMFSKDISGTHRELRHHPVTWFYLIVATTILLAIVFSYCNYRTSTGHRYPFPVAKIH